MDARPAQIGSHSIRLCGGGVTPSSTITAPTAPSRTRHLSVSRGSATRHFRTGQKRLPLMPHNAARVGCAGRSLLARWITKPSE